MEKLAFGNSMFFSLKRSDRTKKPDINFAEMAERIVAERRRLPLARRQYAAH